jgi:hypothetical protein
MTDFLRRPTHRYDDPLARIWIACAERIGFRVERTAHAFASMNGNGTILIGEDALLDPDDSLAQMIFHELCHGLVEGEAGAGRVDWGLSEAIGRNPWRERACLRLQAYLAGNVGLRAFFAPTTDFRASFWNDLPEDPFDAPPERGGRRERSCVAARLAAWRATRPPWAPHLEQALAASAAIAALTPKSILSDYLPANENSGEAADLPSLWSAAEPPPAPHPSGHAPAMPHRAGRACANCAWAFVERGARRCRHAPSVRLPNDAPACARWEPATELDCQACGACCREAYHSVEISAREAVNKLRPDLVIIDETHRKLRRDGERCAALLGGRDPSEAYACEIYDDRPRSCREFERGGAHCLDARRRVGLSL